MTRSSQKKKLVRLYQVEVERRDSKRSAGTIEDVSSESESHQAIILSFYTPHSKKARNYIDEISQCLTLIQGTSSKYGVMIPCVCYFCMTVINQ